jgi:hypothetical protein
MVFMGLEMKQGLKQFMGIFMGFYHWMTSKDRWENHLVDIIDVWWLILIGGLEHDFYFSIYWE